MSIRNRFLIPAVVGLLVLGLVTAALASEIFSAVLSREVQRSHDGKIDAIHLETELVAKDIVQKNLRQSHWEEGVDVLKEQVCSHERRHAGVDGRPKGNEVRTRELLP